MKKIFLTIAMFVGLPFSALAADITGHSFPDSAFNVVYTETGTQNGRAFYYSASADQMVCYYPANPVWVVEKYSTYGGVCNFATGNEADATYWENGSDVATPDLVSTPWLEVHNGFASSGGYFTANTPPPPPPPPPATPFGVQTAISSTVGLSSEVAGIMMSPLLKLLSLFAALVGLGWGVKKFAQHVASPSWDGKKYSSPKKDTFMSQGQISREFPLMSQGFKDGQGF